NGRTCGSENRSSETNENREELPSGADDAPCAKSERLRVDRETHNRICHSHTKSKNHQSIFCIVAGFVRLIPVVERLHHWAKQAGNQCQHCNDSRGTSTHFRSV